MDLPFQLSGWDTEARELIAHGYSRDCAIETVTLRYLRLGDYRPLLDAALRRHTHSPKVSAFLVGMFCPEYRPGQGEAIRYEFGFNELRRKGPS